MNIFMRSFIAFHVWLFRVSKGAIGGSFGKVGKVLLLTTTGKKTGIARTAPLMFFESEGKRYIVASNNGAPTHPAWYLNLKHTPKLVYEIGGTKIDAVAEELQGTERDEVFAKLKAAMPQFAGYEGKIAGQRPLPVVWLKS